MESQDGDDRHRAGSEVTQQEDGPRKPQHKEGDKGNHRKTEELIGDWGLAGGKGVGTVVAVKDRITQTDNTQEEGRIERMLEGPRDEGMA